MEQPPKQCDRAGSPCNGDADEIRRHACPARAAAGLDRRCHVSGPVQNRQSSTGRALQHGLTLGRISAYVAVHENGRYVKLVEKGPFPRLVSGL